MISNKLLLTGALVVVFCISHFEYYVNAQVFPGNGGDANGDGVIDITDAVHTLNYLFGGGLPPSTVTVNNSLSGTGRFIDNGDNTFTDQKTGLMYPAMLMQRSQVSASGNTSQNTTGYLWADVNIAVADHGLPYAGSWRVATVAEVYSTFDQTAGPLRKPPGSPGSGFSMPFLDHGAMGRIQDGWRHPLWESWFRHFGAGSSLGVIDPFTGLPVEPYTSSDCPLITLSQINSDFGFAVNNYNVVDIQFQGFNTPADGFDPWVCATNLRCYGSDGNQGGAGGGGGIFVVVRDIE